MPRNEAQPLSEIDAVRQRLNLNTLSPALKAEKPVTVHYTKRDGTDGTTTGIPVFVNGKPGFDTGSITIADPVKGNRTINLHRIHTINI